MKRCPACQRTYQDNQNFCQTDGTRLEEAEQSLSELQKTMLAPPAPPPVSRDLPPTQYYNPDAPQSSNAPPTPYQPTPQWNAPGYPPNQSWGPSGSQTTQDGKPALIGGLITGVLSALSIIGAAFTRTAGASLAPCCSLWAALGGALAAYLMIKSSTRPVRPGEGAIKGLKAGAIGAVLYSGGLIIAYLISRYAVLMMPGTNMSLRYYLYRLGGPTAANQVIVIMLSFIFGFGLLMIASAVGGMIGVAVFEKRKG